MLLKEDNSAKRELKIVINLSVKTVQAQASHIPDERAESGVKGKEGKDEY
jgi:hypothetical protein